MPQTANKTRPTKKTAAAFVAGITDPVQRADAKALVTIFRSVTGKPAVMWGPSIIGFGSYHYKYESGREGDMPLAGFSPRKGANVLYLQAGLAGSDALLKALGKHRRAGGCLHIKRLNDVDQSVLEKLVEKSVAAVQERHRAG